MVCTCPGLARCVVVGGIDGGVVGIVVAETAAIALERHAITFEVVILSCCSCNCCALSAASNVLWLVTSYCMLESWVVKDTCCDTMAC